MFSNQKINFDNIEYYIFYHYGEKVSINSLKKYARKKGTKFLHSFWFSCEKSINGHSIPYLNPYTFLDFTHNLGKYIIEEYKVLYKSVLYSLFNLPYDGNNIIKNKICSLHYELFFIGILEDFKCQHKNYIISSKVYDNKPTILKVLL